MDVELDVSVMSRVRPAASIFTDDLETSIATSVVPYANPPATSTRRLYISDIDMTMHTFAG